MRLQKQQSAVEFIITYSWAILFISLFVVSVFVLSDSRPSQSYLQSTCNIQPLLQCSDALLTYRSGSLLYYIVFVNQLGSTMYFAPNTVNITATISNVGSNRSLKGVGRCTPSLASSGATVLCNATIGGNFKPGIGTQQIVNFVLNYSLCGQSVGCSSVNSITSNYISSGYSVSPVSANGVSLDYVTFNTASLGTIVLSGVTYFGGTSTYLPSGNYVVFAQPTSGHVFVSWNAPVQNQASQNTILILQANSNTVVTAVFR